MEPPKLFAGKRLTKPVLFGTLFVGLAAAFYNRHRFFPDVTELRAQEQALSNVRRLEFLERRQRQRDELAEKRRGSS